MTDLCIKQGETLQLGASFRTDDDTAPIAITAAQVMAQARDSYGNLLGQLTVTQGIGPGLIALSAATGAWPLGLAVIDLAVQAAGVTQYSQTITVQVDRPVTQGAHP